MQAFMYSGVPKAGAPDFMSTFDVNPPYTNGAPGRVNCDSARQASASAFCSTRAPASVTGAMAPARVKGVTTQTWLRRAISMMPMAIGPSSLKGELVLITV
jgi:hypothetical protein